MGLDYCKICNNGSANQIYLAKEMMFGFPEEFHYLECSDCGCLQLINPPAQLEKYYPEGYYSYTGEGEGYIINNSFKNWLKKKFKAAHTKYVKFEFNLLGAFLAIFVKDGFPFLKKDIVNFKSEILDVGCGAGYLLLNMRYNGFVNLTGIDPFLSKDIRYDSGVHIYKKTIFEMEGKFDLIMMHHSFEHMDDPLSVLKKIFTLLNPGGYALINIPVSDSWAWRKYGVNWVQLDAPRHLFLHTTKSIRLLASESGFEFIDKICNSTEFQFTGSELYLTGQNLNNGFINFSTEKIKEFKNMAASLNKEGNGDSAVFYLKKPFLTKNI